MLTLCRCRVRVKHCKRKGRKEGGGVCSKYNKGLHTTYLLQRGFVCIFYFFYKYISFADYLHCFKPAPIHTPMVAMIQTKDWNHSPSSNNITSNEQWEGKEYTSKILSIQQRDSSIKQGNLGLHMLGWKGMDLERG